MSQRTAPKRSAKVNADWNVDVLRAELSEKKRSLREILRSHATATTGWQGLYNDTCRWRKMDPDLQRLIDDNAKALGTAKRHGGRKRNDVKAGNTDWRMAYVEEYLRTNSRDKAALVTPYTPEHITSMLNQNRTEFDKLLFEMMEVAEQRQVNKAAEVAFNAMDEAVTTGASVKDKAYIALGILKTHNKGWQQQQKIDVNVSGSVKFELDRGRIIGELLADQQRYFANTRPLALSSGDVVDAEEVKVGD